MAQKEEFHASAKRRASVVRDTISQAGAQGGGPGAQIAELARLQAETRGTQHTLCPRPSAVRAQCTTQATLCILCDAQVETAQDGLHFVPAPIRAIRHRVITFTTGVVLDAAFTEAVTVELRHESRWWSAPLASMRFKSLSLQGRVCQRPHSHTHVATHAARPPVRAFGARRTPHRLPVDRCTAPRVLCAHRRVNLWWDPEGEILLLALPPHAPLRLWWSSELILLPGLLNLPVPDVAEDSLPALLLCRWLRSNINFRRPLLICLGDESQTVAETMEQECAIRVLQAQARVLLAKRRGRAIKASATRIQSYVRGSLTRRAMRAMDGAAVRIQSFFRGGRARKALATPVASAAPPAEQYSWAEMQLAAAAAATSADSNGSASLPSGPGEDPGGGGCQWGCWGREEDGRSASPRGGMGRQRNSRRAMTVAPGKRSATPAWRVRLPRPWRASERRDGARADTGAPPAAV